MSRIIDNYNLYKYSHISGRYLPYAEIRKYLKLKASYRIEEKLVGHSVKGEPITLLKLGRGDYKVFMWSQMHGNESTTTKAVLDLINFLNTNEDIAPEILDRLTLYIIPILNPDGANAYTRVNANKVDLNRDSVNLTQPESKVLRKTFEEINPDFCFNLHDQRTIFSVGNTNNPATISFLAPSEDEARTITPTREKAMELISIMVKELQAHIPGKLGRFDDSFNLSCIGDMFTHLGKPTILFEAGHYPDDYEREVTRKYIFLALVTALQNLAENEIKGSNYTLYLELPENEKRFFDILIKNYPFKGEELSNENEIGVLFKENLQNNNIFLFPYVEKIGNLQNSFGHKTIDASTSYYRITKQELLSTDMQKFLRKL